MVNSIENSITLAVDSQLKFIACNTLFHEHLLLKKTDCIESSLAGLFVYDKNIDKIIADKIQKIDLVPASNLSEIIRFNISPILLDATHKGYLLVGKSIKIKKNWEESLYQILKGTYNEVGGDFFKSITQSLAKSLNMKYAFIGELVNLDSQKQSIKTITFWKENLFENNFIYELEGSPCEHVIDRKQLLISDNVADLYPKDKELKQLGIKSYIGTPIFYQNGEPMAIVVVMDTKPIQISKEQAYKLNLFANRIGVEMEWVKKDEALKTQEIKLRTILKSIPQAVYVQNNEGIFENCNDAFLRFFNLTEEEIIDKPIKKLPKSIAQIELLSPAHNRETKGVNRIEATIQTAEASKKEVIIIKSPIIDLEKKRTGIVGVVQDISDMKDAEKLLWLKEEKYHTLFTKANDAFLLMNQDTIIDCNPKALEIFGCTKDKLIGSSPHLFSPNTQPDKQNSKTKALAKINEALSGNALTFFWKHKKYNGELFDAEVSLNAFHIKDELLVQAIVRDVTESVKATNAIEKQTLRMEKMYKLTSDTQTPFNEKISNILKMATESMGMQIGGLSKVDCETYIFLNTYSNLPDFSAEDVRFLSQTYCSITVKENRLVAIPHFAKSSYAKNEVYKLLQLESYIGVPYWVRGELRGTVLFSSFYSKKEFSSFDANFVQMIAQWIGAAIEREEYEERLLKKQALLNTLLREIPIDFSVRDANLKMVWQSNKSKDVWGDNVGKPIDFNDTDKTSAKKWKALFQKVLRGEIIKGEDQLKIYGKQHLFFSIASPIKVNDKVEQVMVVNIDISQIKKTELKLQAKNAKLKKLNVELDRFVYSASHDLRAPLASLLGLIDLSRREKLSPHLDEYLSLMNKSIITLDGFISDITDYSRNLRLKSLREKIDFKPLASELFASLAFMSKDNIDFSINVSGRFNFYSDSDRLKLILNNLISNSIRYRANYRPAKISIEVTKEKKSAIIKVMDNGIGIEKQYQSKIFKMFYRANDQNTGSGLGLFIVKETTGKLKGKIKLESEIGKGTTISIWLPNAKP